MILSDHYEKLTIKRIKPDGSYETVVDITDGENEPIMTTADYSVSLKPRSNNNDQHTQVTEDRIREIFREELQKVAVTSATGITIMLPLDMAEVIAIYPHLKQQWIKRIQRMMSRGSSRDYRRNSVREVKRDDL